MSGNVHFSSRKALARRLGLNIALITLAVVLLAPGQSTGVHDNATPGRLSDLKLAVSHQHEPAKTPIVQPEVKSASRPGNRTPQNPALRVKTGYHAIIKQAGRKHGVETALIQAIIMAESSYNPRAVSNRGAAGLMQLMPATADSLGVKDRFDPEHNIDGGVRYFKILLERFDGDTRLALAAYNAGDRKVRQYNGIPPFKTTRSYIARVFQYYEKYKDLANSSSANRV